MTKGLGARAHLTLSADPETSPIHRVTLAAPQGRLVITYDSSLNQMRSWRPITSRVASK